MKMIALTSANETAMAAVAAQLLAACHSQKLGVAVAMGIHDAHAAQAIYREGGELWRIGEDDSRPELDVLIDCAIDDGIPDRMAIEVDQALRRFVEKARVREPSARPSREHEITGDALAEFLGTKP